MLNQGSPASFSATASSRWLAADFTGYAVLKNALRGDGETCSGLGFSGGGAGFVILAMVSGIRVQPGQQVRHSEEGEHHNGESKNREVSRAASTPAPRDTHVQVSGVDEPRDRRPRLFGVPVPVGTPGAIRPVGAGGDHQGKQGEGNANCFVRNSVKVLGVGQQTLKIRTPPKE